MSRAWLVVIALAAGVVAPESVVRAAESKSKSSSTASATARARPTAQARPKSTRRKLAGRVEPGKPGKPGKRSRPARTARLTAGKARGSVRADNMPRGFEWPPTPQMLAAERECEAALDAAGVVWRTAPPEGRIVAAITIPDMTLGGVAYANAWGGKRAHKLDCQLALALHTVGAELHAIGVREVKFGSIYRWSKVRVGGKTKRYLSRHALGLAMDVVAFVDEAGRIANVKADYHNDDPLLLAVEHVINSSGKFRLVLTPANDPISHSDHFHIEAASDFTTR